MDIIYDWAAIVFPFDVLWADQEGPRPETPYATLHWFGDRDIGFAESLQTNLATDIEEQVQQLRRLTIQMEVYGGPASDAGTDEPLTLLESALLTLQVDRYVRLFRESGISFMDHETILSLDEYDGDRWERRALCDVHFHHLVASTQQSIGRIDTAQPVFNFNE